MKIFIKILGTISIILGVVVVFVGISSTNTGFSSGTPYSTLPIVIGGGFFMALGIAIFILNKNK